MSRVFWVSWTGKESLTSLSNKVDLAGQRVFVRVDFNGRPCMLPCLELVRIGS